MECKIAFAIRYFAGLLWEGLGQAAQHRKYTRTSSVNEVYFSWTNVATVKWITA